MLVEIFLEGLCLALDSFHMTTLETRICGIEDGIERIRRQNTYLVSDIETMKDTVNRQANFQTAHMREEACKLLSRMKRANSLHADVLAYFVSSMSSHITAISFKGKKKTFKYGLPTYRGFIVNTQTPERIFQILTKFQELSDLTGGRIVTSAVSSHADMKATAVAIAAFFKIAEIFGVNTCGITDEKKSKSNVGITFLIEGRFSVQEYQNIMNSRNSRIDVIKSNRKNIYILGPNGAGKSSWGNLISGEKVFEVGTSNHTTMIPQPCDVEAKYGFRLWDTPGLFDGTEEQASMEEYLNRVVDVNGYCSAVLFVFSNSVPANEATRKIFMYALERFGEHVKKNFFVILNNFGAPVDYKATYSEILDECGFVENGTNVIVSSAVQLPNNDCHMVRNVLCEFKPKLVAKHMDAYNAVIRGRDLKAAVANLYLHGRQELESILKRGKIETVRYMENGPKKNTTIPKDVIYFKQHSKNLFLRRIGFGNDKIIEERSVQLNGPSHFRTLIRAQLNVEYTIKESGIFLNHILGNPRYILIHTPNGKYDYELRDATSTRNEELQDILVSHLMEDSIL